MTSTIPRVFRALRQSHDNQPLDGHLVVVHVQHDAYCAVNRGEPCGCDPMVTLGPTDSAAVRLAAVEP